jgi:hypothetical protein
METRWSLRWLLLAAALIGCGKDPDWWPPPDALEVPREVTVAQLESYGGFSVSWTLTTTQHVEVQARIASGSWQTVNSASYMTGVLVGLDPSQPERTPVSFRARTISGGTSSDWSAEASSDYGLRPPFAHTSVASGKVLLSWQSRNDVDGLLIERTSGYVPQPWTVVTTVATPGASYVDDQVQETQAYEYRLTWVLGSLKSRSSRQWVRVGVQAPTGLTAVLGVETVQLAWQNVSTVATEVVVCRADGLLWGGCSPELAHLPPTATSFSDVGVPTGLYTYTVQPRVNGVAESGATVGVATLPPAASGSWTSMLVASSAFFPSSAALDDADRLLGFSVYDGLVGLDQAPWLPHTLPSDSATAEPGFLLDHAFHPHLVYLRNTAQGTNMNAVVHDWFSGTDWNTEELARVPASTFAFALDPTDHPVALTSADGTGPGLRVIRWSGSAYVVEDPGISFTRVSVPLLAVSPEGKIHVLAQADNGDVVHAFRGASWATETAQLPQGQLVRMLASTGDSLDVVTSDGSTGKLQLTTRGASGWGSPVSLDGALDPASLRLASSVTGASPVLVASNASGLQLARESDGWTQHVLTGTYAVSSGYLPPTVVGLGYDASDRMYVILYADFVWDLYTAWFVIYREQ